jgi:aminoglycoside phosphotransferase (APT) family kinase protein
MAYLDAHYQLRMTLRALDEALVRGLLEAQRPDLAELPIQVVANGWDNVIVRLGGDLAARLPRRAEAAALIETEQRWLVQLASTARSLFSVAMMMMRAGS